VRDVIHVSAAFVGVLIAALLLLTTPVGTGQGIHAGVLLHPVLPHVHLLDGRIVSDDQLAAASSDATQRSPTNGPALGAGSGADAAGLGIGLGPTLPDGLTAIVALQATRLSAMNGVAPTEFRDIPPDPPPNLPA
jgi:hypothetical protein